MYSLFWFRKTFKFQQLLFKVYSMSTLLLIMCLISPLQADAQSDQRGEYSGAVETVYPDWFKVSFMEFEEDVAEAAANGKRLMLIFHQNGCPYCNAFVERNLAQIDIVNTLKTKFDVIEINMWGDREVVSVGGDVYTEKAFAEALQVQFTPTVLFLTEEGELALRINGYYDPDKFRHVLNYVSNKLESEQTFADYLAMQSDPTSSKSLIDRGYYTGPAEEFSRHLGKGDKPQILLFEQGSCKNCESLHDSILSKAESQELLGKFDIYRVDMWGRDPITTDTGKVSTGRQWSSELGINYAPTMILYSADGTEVIRSESFLKTFHTQSIMAYVASDAWRDEPNFQRYLSARADELRNQGVDVNIWD